MEKAHHHHSHATLDKVGIAISSLCFIHCVLSPLVVFSMPFLIQSFHHPLFHIVIALLIVPVGLYSFIQGYRSHRRTQVLLLGIPGLLVVGIASILPHWMQHQLGHSSLNILGSVLLISAHWLNRKGCKSANC